MAKRDRSRDDLQVVSIKFTFVNQSGPSVMEKPDEEDIAIIKSHAMRAVHRQRQVKGRTQVRNARERPRVSPMLTDWEGVAITQFFEDFCFPLADVRGNHFQYLDFLPSLYDRHAKESYLTEAVSAVALARLANQQGAERLCLKARRFYGHSLNLVNKALNSGADMANDQVLATLCLLTKYEIVSGDQSGLLESHEKGQSALICHRGKEQLKKSVGNGLFRLIFVRQQLNCIAQAQKPPPLPDFDWTLAFPTENGRRLMRLIYIVADICGDAKRVFREQAKDTSQLWDFAQEAQSVDVDLLNFRKRLDDEFPYDTIDSSQVLSATAMKSGKYYPEYITVFRDLHHASIWNIFLYGAIHILKIQIQYISLPIHGPKSQNTSLPLLRLRLHLLVDEVCASMCSVLGDNSINDPRFFNTSAQGKAIGAHYAVWLLSAALSVPEIPAAQRTWLQDRLRMVGYTQGIKTALTFA